MVAVVLEAADLVVSAAAAVVDSAAAAHLEAGSYLLILYLKSAIVDLAALPRRRVCSRSKLLQTPCNTKNAVKGSIPKGTNLKNFFYLCAQPYDAPENQIIKRKLSSIIILFNSFKICMQITSIPVYSYHR